MENGASLALVVPTTGELVSLDDPQQCVNTLLEIRELEERVRELKRALSEAIAEHSRMAGTKTLTFGDMTASVGSRSKVLWDVEVLEELLAAGLPAERFDQLVTAEVTYKVNLKVANSIASSNEEYAAIIERAKSEQPQAVSVTIRRQT